MSDVTSGAAPSRILVVEDEPAISDVVSTALRHHGHVVTAVDHGLKGRDLALTGDFDLLVLDVMLPGIDGFEVCRDLRRAGSDTPHHRPAERQIHQTRSAGVGVASTAGRRCRRRVPCDPPAAARRRRFWTGVVEGGNRR